MYLFNDDPFTFKSLGLFCDPLPKRSIMQEMILEKEARRHFPLMDEMAIAEYVSISIEQANKKSDNHGE